MVIPLLGVKTRCADKSTAEHYEHTYIGWNLQLKMFIYLSIVFKQIFYLIFLQSKATN